MNKKFIEKCLKNISVGQDFGKDIFNYSISLDEIGNPVETGSDEAEICFISNTVDGAIRDAWVYHSNKIMGDVL